MNSSIRFKRQIRVQWCDFDALGRVPVERWVRWMEETEYEFLRSRGLSVSMVDERGQFGFPRLNASIDCDNSIQLICGDILDIKFILTSANAKQLRYEFEVSATSVGQHAFATGRFTAACCRFPPNAIPYAILIPDWVMERLLGTAL